MSVVTNPIGVIAPTMWIHVAAMVAAYGPLMWLAIGWARTGKLRYHIRAQICVLLLASIGIGVALATPRPTPLPRMSLHGILGIIVYVATLAQAALGSIVHIEYRSAIQRIARSLHARSGYTLTVLVSLQCVLGLAVAFNLCASNECFSAFAASAAAAITMLAYLEVARVDAIYRDNARSDAQLNLVHAPQYAHTLYMVEAVWYALLALLTGLAVAQRDAPLVPAVSGAIIVVILMAFSSVVVTARAHRRRRPVSLAIMHGVGVALSTIAVAVALVLDSSSSDYDKALGVCACVFAVLLALMRMSRAFRAAAFCACQLVVILAARQRGFEVMYERFDATIIPVGGIIVLLLAMGAGLYIIVTQWLAIFGTRRERPSVDVDDTTTTSAVEDDTTGMHVLATDDGGGRHSKRIAELINES